MKATVFLIMTLPFSMLFSQNKNNAEPNPDKQLKEMGFKSDSKKIWLSEYKYTSNQRIIKIRKDKITIQMGSDTPRFLINGITAEFKGDNLGGFSQVPDTSLKLDHIKVLHSGDFSLFEVQGYYDVLDAMGLSGKYSWLIWYNRKSGKAVLFTNSFYLGNNKTWMNKKGELVFEFREYLSTPKEVFLGTDSSLISYAYWKPDYSSFKEFDGEKPYYFMRQYYRRGDKIRYRLLHYNWPQQGFLLTD